MLTECEIQNNWLFYQENLIISNSESLQFKILEFAHNAAVTEHSDCAKIYKIIQQVYYWFMMHDFVKKYVQFCLICAWKKTWHIKKILQFLFILI